MRRHALLGAAILCASLLAAAPAQAESVFGRGWVSTKVSKDGAAHPLFERTKIRVNFDRRPGEDSSRWRADCNHFGAPVRVTGERLITGQIVGTEMACAKRQERQDDWLARFFGADPRWRIGRGGVLRLTAGDRVIRLRRAE